MISLNIRIAISFSERFVTYNLQDLLICLALHSVHEVLPFWYQNLQQFFSLYLFEIYTWFLQLLGAKEFFFSNHLGSFGSTNIKLKVAILEALYVAFGI